MRIRLTDESVKVPGYAHVGDAGIDLRANIKESIVLHPGSETVIVPSGISVHIPDDCFGLLCSRSGLGTKGLNVATGVSIIDSNYRGEVKIPIRNTSTNEVFTINSGDRIAQLIVTPYRSVMIDVVDELSPDENRGDAAFGSSGVE